MKFRERIEKAIAASQSGIWAVAKDPGDAIIDFTEMGQAHGWIVRSWDADEGLGEQQLGHAKVATSAPSGLASKADIIPAIRTLREKGNAKTTDDKIIFIFRNGHLALSPHGSPNLVAIQAFQHMITDGKSNGSFAIVLTIPGVPIPRELEDFFWVIEQELPGREEFIKILKEVGETNDMPKGELLDKVINASSGFTRLQAEGAYALSLQRHKKYVPETLWELKSELLNERGLLSLFRGDENFRDLGGLEAIKSFGQQVLGSKSKHSEARAKGIMLLGPPGTGKSAFAKSLGAETGRPTLTLDIGSLMGSLVGQTEERTREAFHVVDAMAPCILFVDEIEKTMPRGDGNHDSGVSSRLTGTFLTWLNDHKSDVFFIGTANSIATLHPAFTRAERFDAIFFLDLPGRAQKDAIWAIYRRIFNHPANAVQPPDDEWTGAEIKACCRLADLLGISLADAAKYVVPTAVTSRDELDLLRQWATHRVLDAEVGGVYDPNRSREEKSRGRRRVHSIDGE